MTDHAASMKIDEIYQGISLALKLLSKISPSIKSPLMTRKDLSYSDKNVSYQKSNWKFGNETSNMVDASPFSSMQSGPYSLDYDQDIKSSPANEKYDIMQVCVIKSKTFFNSLVTFKTLPWLSNEARLQDKTPAEETDDDDNDDDGSHTGLSENKDTDKEIDELDIMYKLTFTALCRYLVELSCFPCWKSTTEKNKSANGLFSLIDSVVMFISISQEIIKVETETVMASILESKLLDLSGTEIIEGKEICRTYEDLIIISLGVYSLNLPHK